MVDGGGASCLVWRKQAESYSPVWPRGTPCSKPSPANACTLSWSMDDMLVARMGASAGWIGRTRGWTQQTHRRHGRACQLGGNEEPCQPAAAAAAATSKLNGTHQARQTTTIRDPTVVNASRQRSWNNTGLSCRAAFN